MISCVPKNNSIIAIDVLLIPSEKMQTQSLQLNEIIHSKNPETIKLDKNHVPHITLIQCFINEKELPKVNKLLDGLYQTIAQDSLYAESLYYEEDKENSFAMIRIKNTPTLLAIHTKVIELLKPYIVKNGSAASFVQNPDGTPIAESTLNYVPLFVERYSYEHFDPHISLGVAQTELLDSLDKNLFEPIYFRAKSLCVYQLGDHGTAQKQLWKAE